MLHFKGPFYLHASHMIFLPCAFPLKILSPLSIISTIALKIDPYTPPPAHTHTYTEFQDTGIMDRVPMHPYFKVVSLVSLYILSCGSNTEDVARV